MTYPPQADPPGATPISVTTPDYGVYTTRLLDPATPAVGATQVVQNVKVAAPTIATHGIVYGRWLTKPLPAQTIGAGNWSVYAAHRVTAEESGTTNQTLWGMCIAQWRPGTGVIARFVDSVTTGTTFANDTTPKDRTALSTQAGGALTLLANDCVILELWGKSVLGNNALAIDYGVLLGGFGQYVPGQVFSASALTDTDAYLLAPAAITFS